MFQQTATFPKRIVYPKRTVHPKRTVVLIEDNKPMSLLISIMLQRWYHVVNFHDIICTMNWLKLGNYPNLIITDYQMPGIDGFEFIKDLKTGSFYKEIPVILFTGSDPSNLPSDVYIHDIAKIIHKPFEPREFLESIFEIVNPTEA